MNLKLVGRLLLDIIDPDSKMNRESSGLVGGIFVFIFGIIPLLVFAFTYGAKG